MRRGAYAILGLVIALGPMADAANAQMRTGKGEYYSGIQRKPWPSYLYFWITGRDDPAAQPAPARTNDAADRRKPRGSKYPVR